MIQLNNKTTIDRNQSLDPIEEHLKISHKFLEISNQHTEMIPLLNEFISKIQRISDCEAIGMRILDEDGNIPYQAYAGFSDEFYQEENHLSINCDQCMCINVIKGLSDTAQPFYTANGSFYTNSTSQVISEVNTPTRNTCHRYGFQSVALIPLAVSGEIIGLIHLADKKENMIPGSTVETLEWVAWQLASAVKRIKSETDMKENALLLKQVEDNLPDGMVYRLVHTPDGRRFFTHVSSTCETLFQVTADEIKIDSTILYSMFSKEDMERVGRIEKLSLETLESFDFEGPFLLPNGEKRWFHWRSKPSCLEDGSFIWDGICQDISNRKQIEEELQRSHNELEAKINERTKDLSEANRLLLDEIESRKQTEEKLKTAYREIKRLKNKLQEECSYLGEEIKLIHHYDTIIGESDEIKYVLYSMEKIAKTTTTVLIQGESGTGKELVARAIHYHSPRKNRPFIKVDCACLPENLIESELFGHEKGAFSGAVEKRIGRFELADGATIFLDEIGELPLLLQQKLLRVLQDGEFERVGSSKTRRTDVRVIAATNRNLDEDVNTGRFRADLLYRLNVYPLSVPSLRERAGDIPLLVEWIVNKMQSRLGTSVTVIPKEFIEALNKYSWPGNIRELENVIERSMIVSAGNVLTLATPLSPAGSVPEAAPVCTAVKSLADVEKEYILHILNRTKWNVTGRNGAAELLGLPPSTLRGKMRKLNINRPGV